MAPILACLARFSTVLQAAVESYRKPPNLPRIFKQLHMEVCIASYPTPHTPLPRHIAPRYLRPPRLASAFSTASLADAVVAASPMAIKRSTSFCLPANSAASVYWPSCMSRSTFSV